MKKLSMDKLVNTVINERKAKGLTQVQLAEATGINRAMIGRLENSDYIPSIDQLQRLGENLGFEADNQLYMVVFHVKRCFGCTHS